MNKTTWHGDGIYSKQRTDRDGLDLMKSALEHHPREMNEAKRQKAREKAETEPLP